MRRPFSLKLYCQTLPPIYHGSVVEGPGRRSVAQLSGCDRRCAGCFAGETWSLEGGVEMEVREVVERVLDPTGEPRKEILALADILIDGPFRLVARW